MVDYNVSSGHTFYVDVPYESSRAEDDKNEGLIHLTEWPNKCGVDIGFNTGFETADRMVSIDYDAAKALLVGLLQFIDLKFNPENENKVNEVEEFTEADKNFVRTRESVKV